MGAGTALRRRYLELKEGNLNYFKPTPGGAVDGAPDGSIALQQLVTFAKVQDKTAGEEQEFQIKLKYTATADGSGGGGGGGGGSKPDMVIGCGSLDEMEEWAEALVKARTFDEE